MFRYPSERNNNNNMLPSDTLLFLLILSITFGPYLPPSPLPTFSLTFREAMPPSCPIWGSCCGTWSCTRPPCRSPPDHTSPAALQWRPPPPRLCQLSPVQAWRMRMGQRLLWHWWNELCSRLTQNPGASPHQIHSKEGLLSISALSAPHCFVSNAHLMLVRSHLGPPQPCRFTQHYCVSVSHLLDLNVGALCTHKTTTHSVELLTVQFGLRVSCQTNITYLHRLASTVVPGRMVHHLLDFIARPVRVFAKNDALLLGGGGQSHEGVTGGWSHVELTVSPPGKKTI